MAPKRYPTSGWQSTRRVGHRDLARWRSNAGRPGRGGSGCHVPPVAYHHDLDVVRRRLAAAHAGEPAVRHGVATLLDPLGTSRNA